MAVDPRPAASVLIMRDSDDGVEVLFVRRSMEMKFMAGAWVFPGGGVSIGDGDSEDDLAYRRCAIRETFEEARVTLTNPEELVPFSRWITPELAPLRFDTRFYLARAPDGAEPAPDRREVDCAQWWTPAKALHLFVNDEADLHFPTIKQVERLAPFETVDEALADARNTPVEAILPRVAANDDGFDILLPGEPGYDEAK
ncbi:MAG TPA: NUDIX hydrolase [Solirubrobacterales bacterium]|jgi:8-oxo-dGTP pyrophosphatase MutT (NUDIX family)|nr:NUDIX hydrolase [Solirubrobacterales bacterium]